MPPESAVSWIQAWVCSFPGLAWRIEVPRSRLEVLHPWRHPLLGDKTESLLKDAHFRRQATAAEDHLQLTEFWEAIASRSPACAFFRLTGQNGQNPGQWQLLQGWPCPNNKNYYNGLLQPAWEYLIPELNHAAAGRQGLCRSAAGYPVLLVDLSTRNIAGCNAEAAQHFGFAPDEDHRSFFSLMPRAAASAASKALDHMAENPVWSGSLILRGAAGAAVSEEARLTHVNWDGRRLARLSLLRRTGQNRPALAAKKAPPGSAEHALLQQAEAAPSLRAAMEGLLASHEPHAYDALIFSDIKARKGCVTVYGVGKPCADLPWGSTFSYEGTIAQDIERHGLGCLVVDDTLDSIKSIDWVLFVPRGVRSYIARPFYRGGRLHAVLILCSTRPAAFSLAGSERYDVLVPAFTRAIDLWRKQVRDTSSR